MNYLFTKLDISNDKQISIKEFRFALFGEQTQYLSSEDLSIKPFILDLQVYLKRQNTSFETHFSKAFKSNTITTERFKNILHDLDFDIYKNEQKINDFVN